MTGQLESVSTLKGSTLSQKLEYLYDPVGNVTQITDSTQVARFFRNQKVASTNTYQYDSLYQLVAATGRESVDSSASHRPSEETETTEYIETFTKNLWRNGETIQIDLKKYTWEGFQRQSEAAISSLKIARGKIEYILRRSEAR